MRLFFARCRSDQIFNSLVAHPVDGLSRVVTTSTGEPASDVFLTLAYFTQSIGTCFPRQHCLSKILVYRGIGEPDPE
jgi:hypothetical protein